MRADAELRRRLAALPETPGGFSTEQLAFIDADAPRGVLTVLVAAAGSGKTRTLLGKLERDLVRHPARDDVGVITYSNTAVNTFHSRVRARW